MIIKGKPVGVIEVFLKKTFNPDRDWIEFFSSLATQAAVAHDTCHTFFELQNFRQNLVNIYNVALETWSKS